MTIGFLHLGPPSHGVVRFGRLLASELRRSRLAAIEEQSVAAGAGQTASFPALYRAARALRATDVVHLQFNIGSKSCLWGRHWRQWLHLAFFLAVLRRPVVATLHDVPEVLADGTRSDLRRWPRLALRCLRRARLSVASREEQQRAHRLLDRDDVVVVHHLVEPRHLPPAAVAKSRLGLDDTLVLTVLGFIHRRKGHELMVEALATFPGPVCLYFAGAVVPGNEPLVARLRERLQALRPDCRLVVTGYLSEEELDDVLSATDLAVCPFRTMAASGSLSTWIASGRPVVITDLPQVHEYLELVPDAFETFTPWEPAYLASALSRALAARDRMSAATARLRAELTIGAIGPRLVELYAAARRT